MENKEFIKGKAPFSEGIKVGNTVFVSGQIPKVIKTGEWDLTIEGQTKTCLNKIKAILENFGGNMSHVIRTTIYLTNMEDYGKMNKLSSRTTNLRDDKGH